MKIVQLICPIHTGMAHGMGIIVDLVLINGNYLSLTAVLILLVGNMIYVTTKLVLAVYSTRLGYLSIEKKNAEKPFATTGSVLILNIVYHTQSPLDAREIVLFLFSVRNLSQQIFHHYQYQ